jgi:hypothetical protein
MFTRTAARLVVVASLAAGAVLLPAGADAHRSGCHRWHSWPSDHATYRWNGMLCVSPASGESTYGYKKKVVYGGRVYYCKK